jgi:hypothetical protein
MWPGERDEKIQDRWENRRHILLPLARLYADDRWHQLLWGILNRLQEEPLEVGRSALLLVWPFWQISHDGIAAIPWTVAPLAEPPAPMGDQANTAIAIRIWAFHDTFLARFLMTGVAISAFPGKHSVSQ